MAAVKLGLGAVEDWVEQELTGYKTADVPDYRIIYGRPMSQNPVRGWEQIGGAVENLSKRQVAQSIASIEELIKSVDQPGATIHFPFSDQVVKRLNESNGVHGWLAALEVDKSVLKGILDQVRTKVLDWSLSMEKVGVKGSEFDFDQAEKLKAQSASTTINIGNIGAFTGNLGSGNVAADISARDVDVTRIGEMISQLRPHVRELGLPEPDVGRLETKLDEIQTALSKGTPTGVLRGLLVDVKNILIGGAGNLVATGALSVLNAVLGTGVPAV